MLLGGSAVARDGLLDAHGYVLSDGDVSGECCGHGDTLGTPQLEHALDVLAEEGRFDGQLVGVELIDESLYPIEDALETHVVILELVQRDHTEGQ